MNEIFGIYAHYVCLKIKANKGKLYFNKINTLFYIEHYSIKHCPELFKNPQYVIVHFINFLTVCVYFVTCLKAVQFLSKNWCCRTIETSSHLTIKLIFKTSLYYLLTFWFQSLLVCYKSNQVGTHFKSLKKHSSNIKCIMYWNVKLHKVLHFLKAFTGVSSESWWLVNNEKYIERDYW